MVSTIKFSQFANAGDLANGSTTVGLNGGANSYFNNPWTFIASGTTAQRPAPSPAINFRLRFNTDLAKYEFYNANTASWQQLESSGDINALIAELASHTAGQGASMIGLQNQTGVANKSVQDLANATIIAQTRNGTLTNGQFLGELSTGILKSTATTGVVSISPALTSIDALTTNADEMIYTTAPNVYATSTLTATARGLLVQASTPNMLTYLGALPTAGGTMSGNINMGGTNKVTNAPDPTVSSDYATKNYVDATASGLNIKSACVCASTTAYTVIYNNGAAGVGATLTNNGALAAFSADGVSPIVNDRVLIKNQATSAQNGIYTVTTVGDGVTAWVLTRATDFDQPAEIKAGTLVPITGGNTLGGSGWLETLNVAVVGTDPITFIQFSTAIPVTVPFGGTGITSTTAYGLLAGGTTSTMPFQNIGAGLAGQLVQSNGAAALPSYTTATYPAIATTTGTLLRADGTNWVKSTATFADTYTASNLLYSNGANTVTGLATANNGVLITDAGGVPSIGSTLPNAVQDNITRLGTVTSGTWNATTIAPTHGGTGLTSYVLGDTLYASAANTLHALAGNTTTSKQYLSQTGDGVNSAAPVWASIAGSDITGAALTKVDDTNVTLTLGGTPTTCLLRAASLSLGWTGQLAISRGGTNVSSVTTAPTATAFAGWDANKNLSANNLIEGYTTTVTNATTTTLTVGSTNLQYFTGSTTHTVVLPVTSTLVLGQQFQITNLSTGTVTVQSSGGNVIQGMAQNTKLIATCISLSGTGVASWDAHYSVETGVGTVTSVAMTVPSFLSVSGSPVTTTGTLAVTLSGTALPVANGGTGQTSLTIHDVLIGNGTSGITQVAPSATSGVPFISQGASADPAFGTAVVAGGGTGATTATNARSNLGVAWELISTASASSSASVSFTGLSSTYAAYLFVINNYTAGTDNTSLYIRTSTNNGSSYDSGANNYQYLNVYLQTTGAVTPSGSAGDTQIIPYGNVSSTNPLNIVIRMQSQALAKNCCLRWEVSGKVNTGNFSLLYGDGIRDTNATVNAIEFFQSSGNIATGDFYLYGLKASTVA